MFHDPERIIEFEFVRATENAALHAMHWIGAIFSPKWTEAQWTQSFVLRRDFDGLGFVEATTPTRPLTETNSE